MKKYLYTGAWTLNSKIDKHLFGAAMGNCLPKEPGMVRLHLTGRKAPWEPDDLPVRENEIRWQCDGEELIIDIPEEVALEVAAHFVKVANLLEHMRWLQRLDRSTRDQLFCDDDIVENQ